MTGMKNTKRQGKRQRRRGATPGVLDQERYTGPINLPGNISGTRSTLVNVYNTFQITSNASGIVNDSIGTAGVVGALDWGAVSTNWQEYRVLAMELDFMPANRYSKSTTQTSVLGGCIERTNSVTAITSWANIVTHGSFRFLSLETPWTERESILPMVWKANGPEEMQFVNTSAANATVYMKLWADGLTASTVYGRYRVTYLVEFRSDK